MTDASYPAAVASGAYGAHPHQHSGYPYPPQQTIFPTAPPPQATAPAQGSYYHNQPQQTQHQNQDQEESPSQAATNEKNSKWTSADDVKLLDALLEQRALGRARDMKWTTEAWNEIAGALEGSEVISGGGKKTVQQCKARWQRLKIEHRHVKYLREQPLFSWDEETCMVTASNQDWQNYLSDHKDAQPWRKKAFPGYSRVERLVQGSSEDGPPELARAWKANEGVPGSPASEGHSMLFSAPSGSELNGKRKSSVGQTPSQKRTRTVHPHPPPQSFSSASAPVSASAPAPAPTQVATPAPTPTPAYAYLPTPQQQSPAPVVLSAMATAIQVVEQHERLPEEDFVKAVRLFRRRPSAADAYLAIQGHRARTMYLRSELEDFEPEKDRLSSARTP